ncbi:MAG: LytTR family DNA-binding domain-containing protein [Lachnospiraceae bacterium]|jgi:DNA-binding LytR/AlgR family response regulator|nr:LytTR family DNA-binding domain-containing protein [Lachnospiraceae bacterium]
MLKIAICDDEMSELTKLNDDINVMSKEFKITCNVDRYMSSTQFLRTMVKSKECPDILYIDIHMPEINGIDLAYELRNKGVESEIIFNSKSKTHILEAFDVGAFNYIVKNETSFHKRKEIFLKACIKTNKKHKNYIMLSFAGESKTIAIKDIKYFVVSGNTVTVHYDSRKTFEFYNSLNRLQDFLYDKAFIRINKFCLINMDFIDGYSCNDLVMKDGRKFHVGRAYKKDSYCRFQLYLQKKEIYKIC